MNNFSKIIMIALLIGSTVLLTAAKGGRGGGRGGRGPGNGPGGDPGREQRPPQDPGRGGVPGDSRTVLVCPHCNHRLVVVLAPEQGGGRNGGGPGRRPNNGR